MSMWGSIQAALSSFWSYISRAPWISTGGVATAAGLILLGIASTGPVVSCAPLLAQGGQLATVSAINTDDHTVVLAIPSGRPAGGYLFKLFKSGNLGGMLTSIGAGDSICFSASGNPQEPQELDAIAAKRVAVGWLRAIGALLLSFAGIWWVMLAITRGHPWAFALGLDGRLSNSQTQVYLWFLVLATVYLSELGLRLRYVSVLGGITVPTNLLALAGISAFTFGTARLNTMVKTSGVAPAPLSGTKTPEVGQLRRRDLLRHLFTNDDGLADLADMQMVVLSAITGAIYLGISAAFLARVSLSGHVDLPPVDDTLLGGTAISQGAYLFKKLGSRPGLG